MNDQARFVDVHALTDEQRTAALGWAEAAGLVIQVDVWELSWFDDELDARVALLFDSEDEPTTKRPCTSATGRRCRSGHPPTLRARRCSHVAP